MIINFRNLMCSGGGGKPAVIEALSVTANGSYTPAEGTDGYAPVEVNVLPKTEEKTVSIVKNGQTIVEKSADKDGMSKVTVDVNVPAPQPVLETLSVTANGSYTPGAGVDGYSKVDVAVPGGASATALDYGTIGYTQDDPAFMKMQEDLAYSKQKYDEWEAKPNKTEIDLLFYHSENLVCAPLIDTSKVINCNNMFSSCSKLTLVPLFDLSSCTNCLNMFYYCKALFTVPQFDLSSCTDCESMFYNCSSLFTVPQFDLSSCTSCYQMFYECSSLFTVPQFDLSSCTDCGSMFLNCSSLKTIPANLTTTKVENMVYMLNGCRQLEEIGEIDCSSVKAGNMFGLGWEHQNITTLGGFKNLKVSLKMAGESWAPIDKLDKQSLMNVINDLGQADPAFEAEPKLTINAKPFALLTPDDIAIATAKGWTVVSA